MFAFAIKSLISSCSVASDFDLCPVNVCNVVHRIVPLSHRSATYCALKHHGRAPCLFSDNIWTCKGVCSYQPLLKSFPAKKTKFQIMYIGPRPNSSLYDFCTYDFPRTSLLPLVLCTLYTCSQRCRENGCSPRGSKHCLSATQSFHISHTWIDPQHGPPCWRSFSHISTECFGHFLQELR